MKNNIHKKQTKQLNFDKWFCSWTKNNPKSWAKHKRGVRRMYRRKIKMCYDYCHCDNTGGNYEAL